MVELVDYVNITGKITLIETDMTERGATVSFDGGKMTLAELPNEQWIVSLSKFYFAKEVENLRLWRMID